MTDEMDEFASNPQQQQRHKEPGGMTCTTSRRNGETWATPVNAGGFYMARRPGKVGEEPDKYYFQRMHLNDGAKAKRSGDGKQEAGARK